VTKEEYDARYKRPIPGFKYVKIERDKKRFSISGDTWIMIAVCAGIIAVLTLLAILPGLSAAWGAVGLAVQILYGLLLAAGFLLIGIYDEYRYKKRWTRILSFALCALFSVGIFMLASLSAVRDIGAQPVTGTFRVTRFVPIRRSFSDNMVAIEIHTGQSVDFTVSDFTRESKILHEKLKYSEPIVTVTYYPHSKVRIHMEY